MQLIRTIAIILIVYYSFKILFRVFFPLLIAYWANKKMQQFGHQQQNNFSSQEEAKRFAKQKEGEVKIQSHSKSNNSNSDNLGEYVDYEEVK
ncbi:MAG: DUF4834 family protein [Flavobacteriales bacterium]|nr:DUF4834 family protein [Flavobacteriales bacterium]